MDRDTEILINLRNKVDEITGRYMDGGLSSVEAIAETVLAMEDYMIEKKKIDGA
jgi:spore cortex formation protein SpoVR/YcgB (stage V sporulation)